MAKRALLDVQQCFDSDDDCMDDYDPDEHVMEGSDDEFSDLEGNESDKATSIPGTTFHLLVAQVPPPPLGFKS